MPTETITASDVETISAADLAESREVSRIADERAREDPFTDPSLVLADGTKAVISASPNGLAVRTRSAMGSESSASIPAAVALALLDNADRLRAALKGE